MKVHAIRLKPGDDLKSSVQSFVTANGIRAGAILTCVGSLSRAEVRMANASQSRSFDGKFEILSLSGTLSSNGPHLHISLSDSNGSVTGGHLLAGNIVYTTAEIVIAEFPDLVFDRQQDEQTGFNELYIRQK